MNRSILRAEVCLYSAQALPNHPEAPIWRQMGEVLSSDSNQRWEEEDAAHYHPVWLYSAFCYFDAAGDDAYFNSAVTHYYLDYFANQITPTGNIPAYGDAHWGLDYHRWFAIYEKGAAVYHSPLYKWAAEKYWNGLMAQNEPATNLGVAINCIDAAKWCDESITAEPPAGETRLIMDDVVGKKIVFRNGIDTTSTYMMLTYRDEGEDAFMAREYLRTTISAEEEKVHHGHSDENSIPLLYQNGSVLLADGGYRPTIPSGDYGAFRADYFHNRLIIRKNRRWVRVLEGEDGPAEQPLQNFLHNSGAYRNVKTQLIDFLKLDKVEYSRSRLSDDEMGYQWDRSIVYHKAGDFFVVIDAVKAKRRDYFTLTNLWHTRQILEKGDRWYNTRIDSVGRYEVPGDQELLI
ncbi:hypothetical protein KAH55_09665, partial [bacterium]|nr:hypothetical protein [bacterium]